jgi:hypothetical protein
MLPVDLLVKFGFLYLAEKARDEKRWSLFKSALVYLIPVMLFHYFITVVSKLIVDVSSVDFSGVILPPVSWLDLLAWVTQYVVAVIILGLLARFEDTIAAWLITFAAGFILLAFVL